MLHMPRTKVLISYPLKKQNKSHTKEPTYRPDMTSAVDWALKANYYIYLPFGKWRLMEKGQENGLKAENDNSDRKSDRTRLKTKRGDLEKWDQTDSPEISDRGETS